jgi:hypothetical protein
MVITGFIIAIFSQQIMDLAEMIFKACGPRNLPSEHANLKGR